MNFKMSKSDSACVFKSSYYTLNFTFITSDKRVQKRQSWTFTGRLNIEYFMFNVEFNKIIAYFACENLYFPP